MLRRTRGFTLIELLVVIAIIGILAAMLFPVFARARESARKIQCLSNIKNIALAYQMYLTDYDRMPPTEHDQRVLSWLSDRGGGSCWITAEPNPYLKIPVIMDEYIKNRDIWSCPSGRYGVNFAISSCLPDWFTYLQNHPEKQCSVLICRGPFPTGWGGSVTDTALQNTCAGGGVSGFNSAGDSWGTNYCSVLGNREASTSEIGDPVKWVVIGENSGSLERDTSHDFAYELCRIQCAGDGCGVDWENCPDTQTCGANEDPAWQTDPEKRKTYEWSKPRHMGGQNMGFADGHAKWLSSEAILTGGTAGEYLPAGNLFENLQNCRYPRLAPK